MTIRSLVLLSGEETTIPAAEARALFLAYDPGSRFSSPEKRVVIVDSNADPAMVERRIAFARRVGLLIKDPEDAASTVKGRKIRLRGFSTKPGGSIDARGLLRGIDAEVDLVRPDYEFTVIDGEKRYLALTSPLKMKQAWHLRRPRRRAFFHPSAIFPKLSRALVNLTRCVEGQSLLDPFAGTGSIPIEAAEVGIQSLAIDQTNKMAKGSLANMKRLGQSWLGVVRADAFNPPLTQVDAIATDAPYGRASSTRGKGAANVLQQAMDTFPSILRSGSRLVIMHPQSIEVEPPPDLAAEEEHYLYIHKRLTRAITILRRR
ncbi:MAG: RsmD family RNA methyltransferase [Nitrososphaerales archaeon]|nr:RsmD family RNA methyltransferase [Nitrososphaerales archaeon]